MEKQIPYWELQGKLAALKFMMAAVARAMPNQQVVGEEYDSLCTGMLDVLNSMPASDKAIETVAAELKSMRGLVWNTPA